ncbi:TetR/AcrR family transcriptional regulator [Streptomyces ipomoeae]|jgi:AcrR family transcriptional regulator|uniref:TetR/AcrR family transcriptional regulator n=1 Tax=Streptomyces ipomoeae TaxID=103232 RepID=A0A540PNV3_9ACTN|nr:TetR/AcrR family transcriptional regulator [Streptomyces ipomoeae]MDX2822612.1 TetR/AcrR family transcriptional regulator [Streptomyces ipomoeae]MDX2875233.1 TetR/AcrR family transcriptional regulator [Streptomyces ipomoeae]MDX2933265.1 TetR/AcrR family transcriptional regulator [Streptomyces ipomoeae]TQE19757.1 TetR/AcrR family transcriptional regulator [Streptomyces ipomoeae]TQE24881.1 TetR/AcrR family transcriptional regulator [Streptomyces ipomoeae]
MSAEKPQAFQSVWTRPRTGREQPALSREQIVAEALRLLDEEGIDALSMRKLGGRLGAGATSLYRHVTNKDELIELAVDEVYGEIEVNPSPDPANWRTDTARCAHSLRATILRHPWLASVLGEMGMSYLGPNWMRVSEAMLKLLTTAGFPAAEADRAVATLVAYVTGMATSEAAWLTVLARSGQDEQSVVERLWPAAEEAAQDYPLLREGYAEQRGTDPRAAREEGFQYGLERVLDGLETRLT